MKRELRNSVLAVFTAAFVVFAAGCQSMQPLQFDAEPIEKYGGGGGDA